MTNDWNLEDTRQPPEYPEAIFCDDCGEETEVIQDYWGGAESFVCKNPMCPIQFNVLSIEWEMAVLIVELKEENHKLKIKANRPYGIQGTKNENKI